MGEISTELRSALCDGDVAISIARRQRERDDSSPHAFAWLKYAHDDWHAEEAAPLLNTLSCRENCYRTGMQELRRLRELRRRECDRAASIEGDGSEPTTTHRILPTSPSPPLSELTAAAQSWRWMWLYSLGAMCVVAIAVVCVNAWNTWRERRQLRATLASLQQQQAAVEMKAREVAASRETTQAAVAKLEREVASEQKRVDQLNYEVATHEGSALFEPERISYWQRQQLALTEAGADDNEGGVLAASPGPQRWQLALESRLQDRAQDAVDELIHEDPSLRTHRDALIAKKRGQLDRSAAVDAFYQIMGACDQRLGARRGCVAWADLMADVRARFECSRVNSGGASADTAWTNATELLKQHRQHWHEEKAQVRTLRDVAHTRAASLEQKRVELDGQRCAAEAAARQASSEKAAEQTNAAALAASFAETNARLAALATYQSNSSATGRSGAISRGAAAIAGGSAEIAFGVLGVVAGASYLLGAVPHGPSLAERAVSAASTCSPLTWMGLDACRRLLYFGGATVLSQLVPGAVVTKVARAICWTGALVMTFLPPARSILWGLIVLEHHAALALRFAYGVASGAMAQAVFGVLSGSSIFPSLELAWCSHAPWPVGVACAVLAVAAPLLVAHGAGRRQR